MANMADLPLKYRLFMRTCRYRRGGLDARYRAEDPAVSWAGTVSQEAT